MSSKPFFQVEHFGLAAEDPTRLKEWYVRALGAEVVFENGQTPPAYFVRIPGLLIEIYQSAASGADVSNNAHSGWRHLALRVDSIESARARLEAAGVVFSEPIKPAGGGGRVLFFQDTEGNLLHLVERPPGSPFH